MFLHYYSNWIIGLFILWSVGYLCKIHVITNYINPYYTTLLTSIGFTCLVLYYICIQGYKFELSFLLVLTLIHFVPLYVSYKFSKRTYVINNLIISLVMYGIYMLLVSSDPITVYLINRNPSSWKDIGIV